MFNVTDDTKQKLKENIENAGWYGKRNHGLIVWPNYVTLPHKQPTSIKPQWTFWKNECLKLLKQDKIEECVQLLKQGDTRHIRHGMEGEQKQWFIVELYNKRKGDRPVYDDRLR